MAVEQAKSWVAAGKPEKSYAFAVERQSIFTAVLTMFCPCSNHVPTVLLRFLDQLLPILFWYSSGMEPV